MLGQVPGSGFVAECSNICVCRTKQGSILYHLVRLLLPKRQPPRKWTGSSCGELVCPRVAVPINISPQHAVVGSVLALELDKRRTSDLTFLGLSFLIYKMRIIIASTCQGC